MNQKSKRIVFFGNERLATGVETNCSLFRLLLELENIEICTVIISQKNLNNSRTKQKHELIELTSERNIPVLTPHKLIDSIEEIKDLKADIGFLAAYGKIVPQEVIDVFPLGIVNLHPSLLPLHRGSTPIESAILSGEEYTGVSLMRLAKEMDAGPIFAQREFKIPKDISKQELAYALDKLGADLFLDNSEGILSGELAPAQQSDNEATYDMQITKDDGLIDWSLSALEIVKKIRAYQLWPKASATLMAKIQINIIAAKALMDISGKPGEIYINDNLLGIYAGEGVVIVDRLVPIGKKEMDSKSFLSGYSKLLTNTV